METSIEQINNVNTNTDDTPNKNSINNSEKFSLTLFMRYLINALTIFGVVFILFTYIFQIYLTPISIVGRSMQPTINIQSIGSEDYTHCDLVYYKKQKLYNKKDIIILNANDYLLGQEDSIIKRIIATGDDTLTFDFYNVELVSTGENTQDYRLYYDIYLNNNKLSEDYIKENSCYINITTNDAGSYVGTEEYTFLQLIHTTLFNNVNYNYLTTGQVSYTLNNNEVFVCGDNRNHSIDSRFFGAVKTDDILGKMVINIPYGTNFFVGIFKSLFNFA